MTLFSGYNRTPKPKETLPTDNPSIVAIVEAENVGAVTPIRLTCDDLFDTAVFPIITAEEGLEMLRQRRSAWG